jgi:hypothetical protein
MKEIEKPLDGMMESDFSDLTVILNKNLCRSELISYLLKLEKII